tara:strand:- start:436 stop:1374 length:939 start_codon:yes stop_codon:yes gene_type:complete
MGIHGLNNYIKKNCINALEVVHFKQIKGKIIVVDISIYLYKFKIDDALIRNMYHLFSIFHFYNIVPIFVFDGKPPGDKNDTLKQRRTEKLSNIDKYNDLYELRIKSENLYEQAHIQVEMNNLKKNCVCMKQTDIDQVKELISAFGYQYYTHYKEADQLCAHLVKTNQAWACLSEDMDLFVYGCHRVMRYVNLLNHTFTLYDTKSILNELEMKIVDFRHICILSGTDYNSTSDTCLSIDTCFQKYNEFVSLKVNIEFEEWLSLLITNESREKIHKIKSLFEEEVQFEMERTCVTFSKQSINTILKFNGFIFPR